MKVDVKGIGELNFPDDMSRADIEKAIKEHPEYDKVAKQYENSVQGAIDTRINKLSQGNQDYFKKYNETYKKSGAGDVDRILSPAVAALTMPGKTFLGQLFGQSALGGYLGGSEAASKNENILEGTKEGAIWGTLGPILGKIITPTRPKLIGHAYKTNQDKLDPKVLEELYKKRFDMSAKDFARLIKGERAAQITNAVTKPLITGGDILRTIGGGIAGTVVGAPWLGAGVGYLTKYAPDVAKKWFSNQSMTKNNGINQRILNALIQSQQL